MIKAVLLCLDNATKGTIYKIGLMPELTATRVLSGARKEGSDEIEWGLPAVSDYNPPGKSWEQYRDQRQPGSRVRRPIVPPPIWISSAFPCPKVRVSSGEERFLCSACAMALSFLMSDACGMHDNVKNYGDICHVTKRAKS